MPYSPSLVDRVRGTVDVLYREIIKFGVVGAVAFVIDIGSFNLLRATVLQGEGDRVLSNAVIATIISAFVATCFAWIGNRTWTFRHRRNRPVHHEALLFALTNGVALVIQAVCVGLTNQLIAGETGWLAENAAKIVGIGLGTMFRFWAYRRFVFSHEPLADTSPLAEHHQPHS